MSPKKNRKARPKDPRGGCSWEAIGEEPKHRKRQPTQKHMDDVSREMEREHERQFPPNSGSVSSGGKP